MLLRRPGAARCRTSRRSTACARSRSPPCCSTTAASRWLPGGFLGVDVFFVLSGFLITSLLLAEREATGRIDLARFWLRRARRLLPAAFARHRASACSWWRSSRPARPARTRGDALAALVYVTNWHQMLADQLVLRGVRAARRCCSTSGRWRSRSSSTCSGRCSSGSALRRARAAADRARRRSSAAVASALAHGAAVRARAATRRASTTAPTRTRPAC